MIVATAIPPRRRGRPRRVPVDLAALRDLNLGQAVDRCRELGKPRGRARIMAAIADGLVLAGYDPDHPRLTWQGNPQLLVNRESLEAWLNRPLRPYVPPAAALCAGAVRLQNKGVAATAPRSRG